ncbi:unnamed protein product, partial [Rotaria sp. Silwood1]
ISSNSFETNEHFHATSTQQRSTTIINSYNDQISNSNFSSTIQNWLRDSIKLQSNNRSSTFYDKPWSKSSRPSILNSLQRDIQKYNGSNDLKNTIEAAKKMLKNGVLDYHNHADHIASTLIICANCYLKANHYVHAIQYASEALQYNKTDTDAVICRARAFENEKFYADYARIPSTDFSYTLAQRACEKLAIELNKTEGETWREKLPKDNNDDERYLTYIKTKDDFSTKNQYDWYRERGNQLYLDACFILAIRCYTYCIELKPDVASLYSNRAACYLKVFEPQKTIDDCDKALEIDPDNARALYRKACAYKMSRNNQLYEITLKNLIKLQPNNQTVLAEYYTSRHEQIPRKMRRLRTKPITTDTINIADVSEPQTESDLVESRQLSQSTKETIEHINSLLSEQEKSQEKDTQKFSDHQTLNTINTTIEFESSQNTSTNDTILNNMQTIPSIANEQNTNVQFNMETKAKEISNVLQQTNELHEENFEKNVTSFVLNSSEKFQGDLEIIRPESISSGKMNENQTLNFELDWNAALLFYHPSIAHDLKQETNTILMGKIAEFVNDSQYVKTKAQRLFAKTISPNIVRQPMEEDTIGRSSSPSNLTTSNAETISAATETRKLPAPSNEPSNNIKSSAKTFHRNLPKSIKKIDDIYINSLTNALRNLFARSEYHSTKLQKIHEELITSGHISPLNEFYRSSNEALRVTVDHCNTYADLIKWTLSLLQTNNKPNLINFGHDLYLIAIDLEFALIQSIDNTRCAIDIQENLKHELQTITEIDLREINSYLNASQLDKLVHLSKKLNVISKDRMISDLNVLLLHLIQVCHTFELKYRPMQTHIR